jgi:glutamate 5-kinase
VHIAAGHYVIIVSSGAIGVGCQRLGLSARPTKIAQKQALAAIGQVHLMRYYEDILTALGLVGAGGECLGGEGSGERSRRPRVSAKSIKTAQKQVLAATGQVQLLQCILQIRSALQ